MNSKSNSVSQQQPSGMKLTDPAAEVPEEMGDAEIVAIKRATKAADPTQQWGDTLAFAKALNAARDAHWQSTRHTEQMREALRKIKHEAVSLADAQVIALEALTLDTKDTKQ